MFCAVQEQSSRALGRLFWELFEHLVDVLAGRVANVKGQEGHVAKERRKYAQGWFGDYDAQGSWPVKSKESRHKCYEITPARRTDTIYAGQTPDDWIHKARRTVKKPQGGTRHALRA